MNRHKDLLFSLESIYFRNLIYVHYLTHKLHLLHFYHCSIDPLKNPNFYMTNEITYMPIFLNLF